MNVQKQYYKILVHHSFTMSWPTTKLLYIKLFSLYQFDFAFATLILVVINMNYLILMSAVDRCVLDSHNSVPSALLRKSPSCKVQSVEVKGCDADDMGLGYEAESQLLSPWKVAVGRQRGLEIHRYAPAVWKKLVVGFLLLHLRCSAGKHLPFLLICVFP